MALPSLQKSWQFSTNNAYTAAATVKASYEQLVYAIKVILTGFSTNPWTVVSSSNAVSAGAADYWTSASSVNFQNSGSRSWIVLKQTGLGSNVQLLMTYHASQSPTTGEFFQFYLSPSVGFTGGTVSANPTASDSFLIQTNQYGTFSTPGAAFAFNMHGMQSTDGECSRIVWSSNSQTCGGLVIDKMQSPATGLACPVATYCPAGHARTVNVWSNTTVYNGANVTLRNAALVTAGFVTMHVGGSQVAANNSGVINQISNEYPLMPMGVYSQQVSSYGFHGFMVDMWNGTTNAAATNGSTYPNDTTRQLVQFGNTVLPWDGSVPTI